MKNIKIKNFDISNSKPLIFIVGPCVMESEFHAMKMAEVISEIFSETKANFIFKASFDKANRTSINSKRGLGLKDSLNIFSKIKEKFNCPILTDVHNEMQCKELSNDIIDIIQIPAFLCRQTDLLIAAANTKKIINVKKGQFLSPYDVPNIFEKIQSANNENILITERGTSFGYNNLINDFKSIDIMKSFEYPVIFDATHSVQEPGGYGQSTGGKKQFIPSLATAAVSIGIAGIFIETHDNPDIALSDGSNMLDLKNLKNLVIKLLAFDELAKK